MLNWELARFTQTTALSPTTASIDAIAANPAAAPPRRRFRRPGDRCNSLRGRRLPPPPFAGVARAPAASSLGDSRYRRSNSRPILQALVVGAAGGHSLHSLHDFYDFSSYIWSNFSSLCHRCSRSKLAQVCIPKSAFGDKYMFMEI